MAPKRSGGLGRSSHAITGHRIVKTGGKLRKTRQDQIGRKAGTICYAINRSRGCSACFHLVAYLRRADGRICVAHVHSCHRCGVRHLLHRHCSATLHDDRRQGKCNEREEDDDETHRWNVATTSEGRNSQNADRYIARYATSGVCGGDGGNGRKRRVVLKCGDRQPPR